MDDFDGRVDDVLCRLGRLHLKACALARPDPVELAHDLFHLETSMPCGVCSFSVLTYKSTVALIRQMEQLMVNLGQAPQFADCLAESRTASKPKRNFIKLLDGHAASQRPKP